MPCCTWRPKISRTSAIENRCAITSGSLDLQSGIYHAANGTPLAYRATDILQHPGLKGLLPVDLIDIVAEAGLHYDPAQLRGSVFHLLGCLSEFGKLGMTCIGRSPEEADGVYRATEAQLLRGASRLTGGRSDWDRARLEPTPEP